MHRCRTGSKYAPARGIFRSSLGAAKRRPLPTDPRRRIETAAPTLLSSATLPTGQLRVGTVDISVGRSPRVSVRGEPTGGTKFARSRPVSAPLDDVPGEAEADLDDGTLGEALQSARDRPDPPPFVCRRHGGNKPGYPEESQAQGSLPFPAGCNEHPAGPSMAAWFAGAAPLRPPWSTGQRQDRSRKPSPPARQAPFPRARGRQGRRLCQGPVAGKPLPRLSEAPHQRFFVRQGVGVRAGRSGEPCFRPRLAAPWRMQVRRATR